MEKKRERRRRDLSRMKARAVRIYSKHSDWARTREGLGEKVEWADPKRNEKLANHIKHCSGRCCGNPRRTGWDEPRTIQELRFEAVDIWDN